MRGVFDGRLSIGMPTRVSHSTRGSLDLIALNRAAEAARAGIPLTTNRVGAMWTWFFTPGPVTNYTDAAKSDTAAFGRFHRAMLEQGVWLPPSQFEAAFLGMAHGEKEVSATIAAAREAFSAVVNSAR